LVFLSTVLASLDTMLAPQSHRCMAG